MPDRAQCGLWPGELAGLRSCYVAERVLEVDERYVGQTAPKTDRSRRRIGLHPLLVAALQRHREEQQLLGLYDDEGFVFCTRTGTPISMSNLRRAFQQTLQPSRRWKGLDDV